MTRSRRCSPTRSPATGSRSPTRASTSSVSSCSRTWASRRRWAADADQILASSARRRRPPAQQLTIPHPFGRKARRRRGWRRSDPCRRRTRSSRRTSSAGSAGSALQVPAPITGTQGSVKSVQSAGGMTAKSEMHPVVDFAFAGSDVKVELNTDITNTVTDDATGTTVLTETRRATIAGELDACPSAAGLVPGSLAVSSTEETSTFAGPACARRVTRDREPHALEHVRGHLRRLGDARQRHPVVHPGRPVQAHGLRRRRPRGDARKDRRRSRRVASPTACPQVAPTRRTSAIGRTRRRRARPRARSRRP